MKRLSLIYFISFFTVALSVAQSLPHKTILWEVSGNGLTQSSYVLGTFHILCEEDLLVSDKVQRAISSTNRLALEVNLTDPNELKDLQSLMISEKLWSDQLNREEILELKTILKDEYGRELAEVDNMSTMGLMSLIIAKTITCSAKGYDMEVLALAMKQGKAIVGLEHLKDQISLVNSMFSPQEMIVQLEQISEYKKNFEEMKDAFLAEDIELMYQYGTDSQFMTLENKKVLLDNRNINWVDKMPKLMSDKSTLFAVGSAHLAGELGVLNLLILKGYTVNPVLN
ncbi:TraB/GumN family protein [Myroides sp. M-43]|uniref:TraB/GumN family protein n=1 Tax=Myroides oncorhynchi TaxID=2893756 RepID=UPI001E4FD05E|nr:TraB/GumN family protein [Myroides oncorhynchi]MCC9042841.1 TraB/GumN family protein [Myroides oncorhynchi]